MAGTPDDEDRQAREFIDRVVETQAKHGYGVKLSKKRGDTGAVQDHSRMPAGPRVSRASELSDQRLPARSLG